VKAQQTVCVQQVSPASKLSQEVVRDTWKWSHGAVRAGMCGSGRLFCPLSVTRNSQSVLKSRVKCLIHELVLGIKKDYLTSEIAGRLFLCNKKASSNYLKHAFLAF